MNAALVTEQKTIRAPPHPTHILPGASKKELLSLVVKSLLDLGGIGKNLGWRNNYADFKYPGLPQYLRPNCKVTLSFPYAAT
jgi:hypothetical protein